MSKYVKFEYSAGYVGTDVTEIYVFDDDATEDQIEREFKEWVESQHSWEAGFNEITDEEAKELEEDGVEIIEQ